MANTITAVKGTCIVCENTCQYTKETIKGDTYTLNGVKVVICGNCIDDLLKALKRRGDIRVKS